jgi:hypothetical protein
MNRTIRTVLVFFLTLGLVSELAARNTGSVVEININEEDLEVDYASVTNWSRNSQTYFGAGFFNAYDSDGIRNTLYNVTLTQVGYTDLKGVAFGIGVRSVFGLLNKELNIDGNEKEKEKEIAALGMRIKLLYTFPLRVKTMLVGTYNFAPKSLSFSPDLERYSEYRVELNIEPIDGGWVYGGVRGIDFKFENRDETYTLNKTAYAGIKIFF